MFRWIRVFALFSVMVFLISACNLPIRTVSSTPPIALTIAAGAATAMATQAFSLAPTQTSQIITHTPAPTDTREPIAQPSATFTPPASTPITGATVIAFAPGATSGDVTGHLGVGSQKTYYFGAGAGQLLMVETYSKNNNVYMAITGADGSPLLNASAKLTTLQVRLPKTQAYFVKVIAGGSSTDYDLQVILPFNIVFNMGAISATLNGNLRSKLVNYYLLRAMGGQTMTVTLTSSHDDVFLTIYGITDGQPLVRSVTSQTTWTGKLPLTQDYMIEAVSTGGDATYTLKTVVK